MSDTQDLYRQLLQLTKDRDDGNPGLVNEIRTLGGQTIDHLNSMRKEVSEFDDPALDAIHEKLLQVDRISDPTAYRLQLEYLDLEKNLDRITSDINRGLDQIDQDIAQLRSQLNLLSRAEDLLAPKEHSDSAIAKQAFNINSKLIERLLMSTELFRTWASQIEAMFIIITANVKVTNPNPTSIMLTGPGNHSQSNPKCLSGKNQGSDAKHSPKKGLFRRIKHAMKDK